SRALAPNLEKRPAPGGFQSAASAPPGELSKMGDSIAQDGRPSSFSSILFTIFRRAYHCCTKMKRYL
ncbi:hypothetical protein PENTCL1PPCAC_7389, partial [Pristionchus entomophagus]